MRVNSGEHRLPWHRDRDRLTTGSHAVHLQVQGRTQLVRSLGPFAEHADGHPFIHGAFGLHAGAVEHHLLRTHIERHLPGAIGVLGGGNAIR